MSDVHEELKKMCESDFQNGHGKAQIRKASKDFYLVSSCESLKQAKLNCNYEHDECILFRSKVRGKRKYTWILA